MEVKVRGQNELDEMASATLSLIIYDTHEDPVGAPVWIICIVDHEHGMIDQVLKESLVLS